MRTIVLMIGDIGKETWYAKEQKRLDVWPRGHRGFVYSLLRAFMVVVQRDLAMSAVIGDIYAGRPVVYATFSGYDEVAHHSGIERPDALSVLRNIDETFERIMRATADAPRPYRVVVLSDHGQSQGPTFFQRYATTLEAVVAGATKTNVLAGEMEDEGLMHLNVTMSAAAEGAACRARSRAGSRRTRPRTTTRCPRSTPPTTVCPRSSRLRPATSVSSRSRGFRIE